MVKHPGLLVTVKSQWGSHLGSPERGVRLAAQLVEAVVDSCLEHAIMQEGEEGSWGTDAGPGVVEGDLHICMLLLLVHKGTQPGCSVRDHSIPAIISASLHVAATATVNQRVALELSLVVNAPVNMSILYMYACGKVISHFAGTCTCIKLTPMAFFLSASGLAVHMRF